MPLVFLMIGSAVCWTLFDRSQFLVRKRFDASDTAILSQVSPVVAVLALYILIGESFTSQKLIAAACIIAANGLVLADRTKAITGLVIVMGLWIFTLQGLAIAFDKIVSPHFAIFLYAALLYGLPGLLNLLLPPLSSSTLFAELRIHGWKLPLLALIDVLGAFFYLAAFRIAEGGSTIIILASVPVLSVLLGLPIRSLVWNLSAALTLLSGLGYLRYGARLLGPSASSL